MSDPLAFARLKIRQAVTNLSDSHSWHLTHHGMPPEAEQRRGDQSAPFFGSDDKVTLTITLTLTLTLTPTLPLTLTLTLTLTLHPGAGARGDARACDGRAGVP